jgi:hypothetical protein
VIGDKMKIEIVLFDKKFIIESKLKEVGVRFPFADESDWTLHNKYTILVSRIIDRKKITRRFYFYDSQENYKKGVTDLDEETLRWAFRCILNDGLSATEDFDTFCLNNALTPEDIKIVNKMYDECQKTLKKLLDLGIFASEIKSMIEILDVVDEI